MDEQWPPTRFLLTLMNDEVERRDQKQLGKLIARSDIHPDKTFESFDFRFNPKINESVLRELALGGYIAKKESVFLLGPSGVGKSHLASALGHEACRRGHEVQFHRLNTLLQWIKAGDADSSRYKRLQQVIRIPLLILDDFGLKPIDPSEQADLYEIICERHERASLIITSNRDFNEWPMIFTNPLMASAAMDRLVHHAIKILIEGKSYRMEEFAQRSKNLTNPLEKK